MDKKTNNWKIWEKFPGYGEMLYERATGKLGEMESSKALCKIIKPFCGPKMKILDVGCGTGHYLRSFKLRVDKSINYTGLDSTEYYIKLAKKAFGNDGKFFVGDIFDLPFKNNAFDIVVCNNVILHLPPPPTKAISELIRVAKKHVVIRTIFGERNYIIKEVRSSKEGIKNSSTKTGDLIDKNGEPSLFNFFNMYTARYLKDVIAKIDKNIKIAIKDDNEWAVFDNRRVGGATATKVIDGKQVSGNLLLDWKFIILTKKHKK